MPKKQLNKNLPAYQRVQGNKGPVGNKERHITFSLSKHIKGEGQTLEDWGKAGLLTELCKKMKAVGQYTAAHALQQQMIKQYTKVTFPPNSGFKEPNHIQNVTWGVMHITPISKEVVAGYLEDDVFYIVFLDRYHKFWPSPKKGS